jgi:hypothetical protein
MVRQFSWRTGVALLAVGWMAGQWNAGRATAGVVLAQAGASEGEIIRAARLIVRADGRAIAAGNLRAALRHAGIGRPLPLEVQRGSRHLTLTPRLTETPQ